MSQNTIAAGSANARAGSGREVARKFIPFIALMLLIAIFAIAAPDRFATFDNARTVFVQTVVLAIVAFGSTLVITSGSIDLSVGSVAALASGRQFDAVFAASDLIAIGAMRALAEAGRRVPQDVAVVGFDDIPAASLTTPPLTTVMQDIKGAGELLIDTLMAQIEGRELPERTLSARLVVRGSSAAAGR